MGRIAACFSAQSFSSGQMGIPDSDLSGDCACFSASPQQRFPLTESSEGCLFTTSEEPHRFGF